MITMIVGPGDKAGQAVSRIAEGFSLTYVWFSLQPPTLVIGVESSVPGRPGGGNGGCQRTAWDCRE